jgi:hypothetical protein
MLQNKSENTEELNSQVAMYEKRDKEHEAAVEGLTKDNEKYQKLAKQYKNKAIKFKFQLKQLMESRAAGGNTGGSGVVTVTGKDLTNIEVASDEINLLNRTVAMLRHQLAETRARAQKEDLAKHLQPLPHVKPAKLFSASHHRTEDNTAEFCRNQASSSPFAPQTTEHDITAVTKLQSDVFTLSKRVHQFRSTPVLVDVSSKVDASTHGQEWLNRQLSAQQISADSSALQTRMGEFLTSKQSRAFRSLLATVPATADAFAGGVGATNVSASELLGRLTLPIASSAVPSSNKVMLRPHQFAQLHSVFVK